MVGGQHHASAALHTGKVPGTHCISEIVGPWAGLGGFGKSRPHQDSTPGPSTPQQDAIATELSLRGRSCYVSSRIHN
jgi:hypothetical protein